MEAHLLKRIIWAVDPNNTDNTLFDKTVETLKTLVEASPAIIEPVYVYLEDPYPASLYPYLDTNSELLSAHKKKLKDLLSHLPFSLVLPPKVLLQEGQLLRQTAKILLKYAKESKSDLIVVSSHARKGVDRFAMGSVTESLVLQPNFPILVVSPKTAVASKYKHLLFVTDFSDKSHDVFNEVLDFAKNLKLNLILYHSIEPHYLYMATAFPVPLTADPFEKQTKFVWESAKKWIEYAKERGVTAEVRVDKQSASLLKGILTCADWYSGTIIALASQSGTIQSSLLGSITREVIRNAKVPVWVLHPKQVKRAPQKNERVAA